jgi:hypothetical protein
MRSYAKHVPRIFLFILVLQLAHFSRAYGQQDAPDVVLHVNVNLVQLDAQVLQKKTGKPIAHWTSRTSSFTRTGFYST